MNNLNKCPKCGGPADNGHDRCLPPNIYYCTECEKKVRKNNKVCFRGQCSKNKEKRLDTFRTAVGKSSITTEVEEDFLIGVCGNNLKNDIHMSRGACCSSLKIKIASNLIYVDKKRRWAIRNYNDNLSSRIYYCPFCGSKLE
jgi:hypothetical protein